MVVVADLGDAVRRYELEDGLVAYAGGRHDGFGTANAIVPLGDDYIELIAVTDVDEAARNPMGQYLMNRLAADGEGVVAVCLRATDAVDVASRTGSSPVAMSRRLPDGGELRWELLGMDGAVLHGLPFFITWTLNDDHPARRPVEHPSGARGIAWVELGGDPERVLAWVGSDEPQLHLVGGEPGVRRFALRTATGEITMS